MSDTTAADRASEIRSWPAPLLAYFRDALFDVAFGGLGTGFFPNQQTLDLVMPAITAGRLIDAGDISVRALRERALAGARKALEAGLLPSPRSTVPIIFSASDFGNKQTMLVLVQPTPENETAQRVLPLTARQGPDGKILLTQTGGLAESDEQRKAIEDAASAISVMVRYLCLLPGALEPAQHHVGIAYSRLDVEKAIRLQTAGVAGDLDGLTISFDGPRGPTQLHLSNELLTGPIERFIRHLREAEFDFDPLHADSLREYLIARRGALGNHEFRGAKTNGKHLGKVTSVSPEVTPPTEILDPSQQDERAPSISEVRRYLCEYPLSSFRLPIVKEAAEHARAGRLFVVENLPVLVAEARLHDADDAIKRGVLRPPFPVTFVLLTLNDSRAPYLLGVSDDGYIDDDDQGYGLNFWGSAAFRSGDGSLGWGRLMGSGLEKRLTLFADVAISLIADSRSPVTRIETPEKLAKARAKNGKPPIPPYWKIEPPKPTVLVPGAEAKPAAAKGGAHASPRPHDRRGHPRHLNGDRTVWVRASRVNALLQHLTRGRSYYEIKLNGAKP
jgi:hypothetical protein